MSSQVGSRKLWSNPHDLSETEAYTPSFIDRFMGLIQRLSGPYWLTLLVLFVLRRTSYRRLPCVCVAHRAVPLVGRPAHRAGAL
jgi:hypothetical protein